MNYTKGKWKFAKGEFNYAFDREAAKNNEDMIGSIVSDGWFICRIDNTPENKVNARLIAAAPDMYEALKAVERIHGKNGWMNDAMQVVVNHPDKPQLGLADLIKSALAKAEGK